MRTKELWESKFENITVDKGNVGPASELCAQNRDESLIQFDGNDAAGLFGELMRQCAEAGTDLQDGVGFLEVSGGGDAGQVRSVYEEVLAQGFLQVEIVAAEQIDWGRGVVIHPPGSGQS